MDLLHYHLQMDCFVVVAQRLPSALVVVLAIAGVVDLQMDYYIAVVDLATLI